MATSTIEEIMAGIEKDRAEAEAKAKGGIKSIADLLAVAGIDSVEIYFDGAGDSGSIEEIAGITDGESVEIKDFLREQIESWADAVLDSTGVDWYNNDGGFGTITIDVKGRTYEYEVNQRQTTSSVEASGTVNVDTGEEI